jgi:hypothetical protein
MAYDTSELPLQTLLGAIGKAEDQLARVDERVRRSPVGEGFIERGHFFDAAASMWVAGELVHVEDLVLHDARMDVRAPTHELTISHTILRARRRIAAADPGWATSDPGIAALTGRATAAREPPVGEGRVASNDGANDEELSREKGDAFADEFAEIDAVLERSHRILAGEGDIVSSGRTPVAQSLNVGELMIRDAEWDEQGRLEQWKSLAGELGDLPASLGAAVLWDAWESLEPMQNQHWLGSLLVSAYLRARNKVSSHLLSFNVGLKAIPRERRRSQNRTTRLLAFLDATSAAADASMKEIDRLHQAKDQMERRLRGRRSSSSLPGVIELVLSRPIVSAAMIAKEMKVTPRGALNLVAEVGIREMTGRGRYRGWGIV